MTRLRALAPLAVVLALGAILSIAGGAFARGGSVEQASRALATAHHHAHRAVPYDLERERYRGSPAWEVKAAPPAARPVKLFVSRDGRRLLGSRRTHRDDDAGRARKASVGLTRALHIAARHASGRLDEAEIDRERGRIVWSVTFDAGRAETEVSIDASTAAVVAVEKDDD